MPEFQLSTLEILHGALEARNLPGESNLETYKVFIQPLGDCIEVNHRSPALQRTFRFNWNGTLLGYFIEHSNDNNPQLVFDKTSGYGSPQKAFSDTQIMLQGLQDGLFSQCSRSR